MFSVNHLDSSGFMSSKDLIKMIYQLLVTQEDNHLISHISSICQIIDLEAPFLIPLACVIFCEF